MAYPDDIIGGAATGHRSGNIHRATVTVITVVLVGHLDSIGADLQVVDAVHLQVIVGVQFSITRDVLELFPSVSRLISRKRHFGDFEQGRGIGLGGKDAIVSHPWRIGGTNRNRREIVAFVKGIVVDRAHR